MVKLVNCTQKIGHNFWSTVHDVALNLFDLFATSNIPILSSIKTTAEIIHDIPNMIFLSKLDYFIKAIEGNL
jgi:hypothetical protein